MKVYTDKSNATLILCGTQASGQFAFDFPQPSIVYTLKLSISDNDNNNIALTKTMQKPRVRVGEFGAFGPAERK